jgi:hypothetical protein
MFRWMPGLRLELCWSLAARRDFEQKAHLVKSSACFRLVTPEASPA